MEKERLIIEADTLYELDLECMKRKQQGLHCDTVSKNEEDPGKNHITEPHPSV